MTQLILVTQTRWSCRIWLLAVALWIIWLQGGGGIKWPDLMHLATVSRHWEFNTALKNTVRVKKRNVTLITFSGVVKTTIIG